MRHYAAAAAVRLCTVSLFCLLFAYAGLVGYSRRKEAWEIVECLREADRALGDITLGEVCARGLVKLDVACYGCPRRGRYRVTRLIDRHGAEMPLLRLKDILAASCPKHGGGSFYNRCGAYFPGMNK